ncbi:MAG: lamin tail domain-containing protein [Proteobacteria bacterium]|nr:lamin tail domain-containing protein [Pseudomonadota bacterium]
MLLLALACRTNLSVNAIEPDSGDSEVLVQPTIVVNELSSSADWVELYNPGTESVGLASYFLTDDYTNKTKYPLTGGIEPAGHALLSELPFGLAASGEAVGLFDEDGEPVDWVTFPSMSDDEVYARIPDGGAWKQTGFGTPGETNVELYLGTEILVGAGETWSYLDGGEEPANNWTDAGYDDSTWARGEAPLGYGDDQKTVIGYGADSSNKHVTTWFRFAFEADDPEVIHGAVIGLVCDDGCLVRVNGTEVVRHALADGDVTADMLASETASGAAEYSWNIYEFDPAPIVDGDNVVSVEVHQASMTSSDLSFDLYLDVEVLTPE